MAARQVVLYFDNPADALRFTLAASSALANDGRKPILDLTRVMKHVTRIRAEDVTVASSQ